MRCQDAIEATSQTQVGRRRTSQARFADSTGMLSDAELLATVIGGTVEEASEVIAAHGGMRELGMRSFDELTSPGFWSGAVQRRLSPRRAGRLLAAIELGRRIHRRAGSRLQLSTAAAVFSYLEPALSTQPHESFHVLCLNSRNQLLRDGTVGRGGPDSCPVDPREVFAPAVTLRAAAVIVAHNHPSGDASPSRMDVELTRQIIEGGKVLGVQVLDHIIVGAGNYVSLRERGLFVAS